MALYVCTGGVHLIKYASQVFGSPIKARIIDTLYFSKLKSYFISLIDFILIIFFCLKSRFPNECFYKWD